MERSFPERDWKQLRKFNPDMLNALCLRINQQADRIIQSSEKSDHKKYLELFKHIQDSDDIVANCFNDWRRSNITIKISYLLANGLLTDDHIQQLSDETQEQIKVLRMLQK